MARSDYDYNMFFSPWWEKYYGSKLVFEYINNHSAFQEYVNRKGLISQIAKLVGKRVSIISIVNDFAKIDLLANKDKKTIIEEVLELYEKYDAQKTLIEWFQKESKKAMKTGRLFTSVTKCHHRTTIPFSSVSLSSIDSKFIVVNGSICYKQALSTNPTLLESASHSNCTWVLCDYPPLAMTESNPNYKGGIINLRMDEGFEDVFSGRVPFDREIGWFPRCTVAGFLNTRKATTENFPTISPSLIMYKRTLSPTPNAANLTQFVSRQMKSPIELDSFQSRLFLYYLVPTMYRSWGVGYDKIDDQLRSMLETLVETDKSKMGDGLVKFYEQNIITN